MVSSSYLSLIIIILILFFVGIIKLRNASTQSLVIGISGAIVGLIIGALVGIPLAQLPHPYNGLMPIVVSIGLMLLFIIIFSTRSESIANLFPKLNLSASDSDISKRIAHEVLVDTSVIIDGRIADIAVAGFVPTSLLVPRFVLAELQNIADSDDAMRRGRGRRGLEVLNRLRETVGITVEILDQDAPEIKEVDAKLVALAQRRNCDVLTTDYNLNRVAQIQGVRVLNINELANAIRPVVLPGEELHVHVVQPGKEKNQGVGYLADGTMIVVENGDRLMNQEVITEVTRVFQTVAGKMIFATPKQGANKPPTSSSPRTDLKRQKHSIAGKLKNEYKPSRNSRQTAEDRLIDAVNNENTEIL
jgi:uncharacterized protein YacL